MEADGYRRDPCHHTIFTCRFIVMDVITDVALLGLHSGKSTIVHNCLRWVLHIMNIEESKTV